MSLDTPPLSADQSGRASHSGLATIVVTGATWPLGRRVVERLRAVDAYDVHEARRGASLSHNNDYVVMMPLADRLADRRLLGAAVVG